MDFVDVNESNARWVQDFRLKAYSSPAKLEAVDGERPGRSGWGSGSRWVCGPQRPLTLFLEHPGACCQALTVQGRLRRASCAPSSRAASGGRWA